ncbi:uncharacterized protein EI90DRAFT_2120 [Cantharellus anzutake]|uniref:uncharacterized protein n=1 Tax=Cantharellus anzutake TaxID=1750568 RepID=UPI0019051844|nr:uncharacterized protein EI90DRAFT_2120 [Cantharellus anzutake]KAF8343771.1 hypothetical protein EI90DRAFT_2120 [Cantharellus anzutake]
MNKEVVNGTTTSPPTTSPGIFASYLHSVPPQFAPSTSPGSANPSAFSNTPPVTGHAPSTSTPQGAAAGATGGIAPASTTTVNPAPTPSNANKVSSRKRASANGIAQNGTAGQAGTSASVSISKQARLEGAKLARQHRQQSAAPGMGRTPSRLLGVASNPNQPTPQTTLMDTTLDASRQHPIYRPDPPTAAAAATGTEVGDDDDDDEVDADADADGDGDEEGMNPTAANGTGVGTTTHNSTTKVANAMTTRMDGLTT